MCEAEHLLIVSTALTNADGCWAGCPYLWHLLVHDVTEGAVRAAGLPALHLLYHCLVAPEHPADAGEALFPRLRLGALRVRVVHQKDGQPAAQLAELRGHPHPQGPTQLPSLFGSRAGASSLSQRSSKHSCKVRSSSSRSMLERSNCALLHPVMVRLHWRNFEVP